MSSTLQISIASLLAIAAAGMNWLYLSTQSNPPSYVAFRVNVQQGQTIEDQDLVAVPVPGDPERLRQALIPYHNRSVLIGADASRNYEPGDMFFARDVVSPTQQHQWDVIGPFELISVGERFKQRTGRENIENNTVRGNTVTIAVGADFDRETSRLLAAIAEGPDIVAVQVVPSNQDQSLTAASDRAMTAPAAAGQTELSTRKSVVYQTISLDGIPNVPLVLLEGDLIRFVIPHSTGF